jgi:hypothetical protein
MDDGNPFPRLPSSKVKMQLQPRLGDPCREHHLTCRPTSYMDFVMATQVGDAEVKVEITKQRLTELLSPAWCYFSAFKSFMSL